MTSKNHFINQFSCPMAIEPDYFASFMAGLSGIQFDIQQPEPAARELNVIDGTAVIQVHGVLMRDAPDWAEAFGVKSMESLASELRMATAQSGVEEILLAIDSPGGSVNGTEELAAEVLRAANKMPVRAFSAGLMASAAYWVGSMADELLVTPSSMIGSIGVIGSHIDASAQHEAEGLKVHIFASGEQKAPGAMNTALSPAQIAAKQSTVREMAMKFYDAVLTARGDLDASIFDGGIYQGSRAVEMNLADGLVMNFAEALDRNKIVDA